MADLPLVSVVIPVFNRVAVIKRAIDSVLAQDYGNFELLVVDDGSTDETPVVLSALAETGGFTLLHQSNRGVSAARNLGISHCHGEFIAFLDSDDEWLPGKITAQVNYFLNSPSEVLVQTQEIWIRNGVRVNPKRKHLKKSGDIFLESLKLCLISPSAVMLRKTLFNEIGFFDENLKAAEDYDLWLRILARHPAGLIDRYLARRYGGHADQLSAQPCLDKYRIMALEKILLEKLTPEKRKAAEDELSLRRRIYENGALKRAAAMRETNS